jgi:hypothetical protein
MQYDFRPHIRKGLEAGARANRNKAEIKCVLATQIALTADNPNYEKFVIAQVRLYDVGGQVSRDLLMPHLWSFSFDAVVARYTGNGPDHGPECILAEIDSDQCGYPVTIISTDTHRRCGNASSLRRALADLFTAAETSKALATLATCDPSGVARMRRPL